MKKYVLILLISAFFISTSYADVTYIDESGLNKLLHQGYNKTVLVFWATYCPYCKALLQTLNENINYLKKNKINIIAISVDKKPSLVTEFVQKVKYPFNFYIDKGDLKRKFNAYYIPLTAIFDKYGHLEDTFPGNKPFSELKSYLED
ncbi:MULTISPECIES: TlpA family protein disulfide reductase [Calditerrivibrio]|uniref:TlpA family protein disulfide reductase n=1 Tax=Calditerrivibrio TaxID=545865 RepID=UPI003C7361B4